MFEFIEKLTLSKSLNIILILFGCLIAPFWFIYQFYPSIYQSNELSKVLVLGLSIGVPICLCMTIINNFIIKPEKSKDEKLNVELRLLLMGISSGYCGFAFYVPCIQKYLFENVSAREAIFIVLLIHAGGLSFSLYTYIKRSLAKNRKLK